MLRIAVVEDNDRDRKVITDAIATFEKEENENFHISEFHNAMDFLEQRKTDFRLFLWIFRCPIWMVWRLQGNSGKEIQRPY